MPRHVPTEPANYEKSDLTPDRAGARGEPNEGQLPRRARRSFGRSAGSIMAGMVLASIVVCVIANLPDIKRYIRISRM